MLLKRIRIKDFRSSSLLALSAVLATVFCIQASDGSAHHGIFSASAAIPEPSLLPGSPLIIREGKLTKYDKVNYLQGKTDPAHQMTIYIPRSRKGNVFPAVVWIHGGAWISGRGSTPRQLTRLVKDGFAVITVNYRLAGEAPYPAQLDDLCEALRFLKRNGKEFNIDTDRVGLWGASAGGHLAALLGTIANTATAPAANDTIKIAAVCDWCGPTNLYRLGTRRYPNLQYDWFSPSAPLTLFLGGTAAQKPKEAQAASPVTYADSGDPPFLIVHGTADNIVPFEQSEELADLLSKAGVDVSFIALKNMKHDFDNRQSFETVRKFFRRKLK